MFLPLKGAPSRRRSVQKKHPPNGIGPANWSALFAPRHTVTTLLAVAAVLGMTAQPGLADDAPVSISLTHSNTIDLRAYNVPPKAITSDNDISDSIEGVEQSQCTPYGRQSAAAASAHYAVQEQDSMSLRIILQTSSYAQGGSFRTCNTCIASTCVGTHPNDERGDADATAHATALIRFSREYEQPGNFLLTIGRSDSGQKALVELTDGNGLALNLSSDPSSPTVLHGTPGAAYFLNIDQKTSATDSGGCCNVTQGGASTLDVSLTKAPILMAGYMIGYIRGGKQTSGYKFVGAITVDGQMSCTGTLIGPHTVLTAAHCLAGFESRVAGMRFVLGANYQIPDLPPAEIDDLVYPKGELGFMFNPKTLEDDIGLLHLKEAQSVAPAALYQGAPTWDTILQRHTSILFVGFGYNVIGNDQVGAGIKREGSWQVDKVENRRVGFNVPGHSTCDGDSGGPAFVENVSALFLAAVTSGGDKQCTLGYETRVDAYISWLKGKIN